ncbi:hypothetical protein KNP414_07413 [Paenibacillus mucilaginosus KNP414]|uniref:Uncharacterized protein n=1 Tax=Paenibacillus mucilaginosus (strain KNP414) TaxID=1036673 RepID=F8FPV0_PAEMK|nr:hypothetical protein KNP414_07413 [Paenibacillus mucilaginosus KNP414]
MTAADFPSNTRRVQKTSLQGKMETTVVPIRFVLVIVGLYRYKLH